MNNFHLIQPGGNLYDVYYIDAEGKEQSVCYFAYSEYEAKRLFKSEQSNGEDLVKVVQRKLIKD